MRAEAGAAVVLMAYGSPDRLDDVRAYLADIRGGRPVSDESVASYTERYRRLGIEDSNPLNAITEATRTALQAALGLPVFVGMKHWQPRIANAAERALSGGARRILGLVLAPHYSSSSIGGYERQLSDAVADRAELLVVQSWHDEPGLIALLADRLHGTSAHVVFTAHSLPARILDDGDPYQDELLATARAVADAAGISEWSLAYQSAVATGQPWLGPDIRDHLTELHAGGVRQVLVCPAGFVADHLEIFWDLDVEARACADALGMTFARMPMPNADAAFIEVLARIVRRALAVPSKL
jgi:ferrochelatase